MDYSLDILTPFVVINNVLFLIYLVFLINMDIESTQAISVSFMSIKLI